jgi:hypothetical protein
MPTSPTEEFLKLIWTRRLYTNRELATCDGRPLRVISHGNINPVAGTDITDAQIEIDGTVYSGPIAVHAQASLWRRHLHHIDMAYDDCILHLVLENDAVVCRVDGSVIPALILEYSESLDNTFRNLTEGEGRSLCCRELKRMPQVSLYNTLTRLTIERLERKYNDFLQLYTEAGNDWNEAFYITLFKSVGASRNREAYIKLARTVRYRDLCHVKESILSVEALLLGGAGMLDTERNGRFPDDYTLRLQQEFDHLARRFGIVPMRYGEWEISKTRSFSHPVLRIVELAGLLARKEFLFSNLINCTDVTEIQRILSAEASEYWATHSLPSVRSSRCVKRFGQMILDVLTINLVVPMMFAYGKDHADDAMQERAVEILEQIAPEKNTYTVPWSERGIRPDNAFFSQALIQLSKEYCEKKRCATCNIGKMLLCSQE